MEKMAIRKTEVARGEINWSQSSNWGICEMVIQQKLCTGVIGIITGPDFTKILVILFI